MSLGCPPVLDSPISLLDQIHCANPYSQIIVSVPDSPQRSNDRRYHEWTVIDKGIALMATAFFGEKDFLRDQWWR